MTLKVYNTLGQEVTTLADHQQLESGVNEFDFDASRMASGVYYYRLEATNTTDAKMSTKVRKMVLIK